MLFQNLKSLRRILIGKFLKEICKASLAVKSHQRVDDDIAKKSVVSGEVGAQDGVTLGDEGCSSQC